MNTTHPRRTRSILYLVILVILAAGFLGAGLGANKFNQSSRDYKALSTFSALCIILFIIYVIPFLFYAVKDWLLKATEPLIPPPSPVDTETHSVDIRFSISPSSKFLRLLNNVGTLSWNNSSKVIKLTSGSGENVTTVFEVPYPQVEKLEASLSLVIIQVNGKSYRCVSARVARGGFRGWYGNSAGPAIGIAAGTYIFSQAGIPELAGCLKSEGVSVVYTNLKHSIELGFVWSFAVLFLGSVILTVFLGS